MIQGRLPLDRRVALDLTFPKAAALQGRVVDEEGRPVGRAKLQVLEADLLDEAGHETNNRQGYDWKALPGSVGRAVTGPNGGFRIEGIADRDIIRASSPTPRSQPAISAPISVRWLWSAGKVPSHTRSVKKPGLN